MPPGGLEVYSRNFTAPSPLTRPVTRSSTGSSHLRVRSHQIKPSKDRPGHDDAAQLGGG